MDLEGSSDAWLAICCVTRYYNILSYAARSVWSDLSWWALSVQWLFFLPSFLSISDCAQHSSTVQAEPENSTLLSTTLPSSSISNHFCSALRSLHNRQQHQDQNPPIQWASLPSIPFRPDLLYAVFNSCSRVRKLSQLWLQYQYIYLLLCTYICKSLNQTLRCALQPLHMWRQHRMTLFSIFPIGMNISQVQLQLWWRRLSSGYLKSHRWLLSPSCYLLSADYSLQPQRGVIVKVLYVPYTAVSLKARGLYWIKSWPSAFCLQILWGHSLWRVHNKFFSRKNCIGQSLWHILCIKNLLYSYSMESGFYCTRSGSKYWD